MDGDPMFVAPGGGGADDGNALPAGDEQVAADGDPMFAAPGGGGADDGNALPSGDGQVAMDPMFFGAGAGADNGKLQPGCDDQADLITQQTTTAKTSATVAARWCPRLGLSICR